MTTLTKRFTAIVLTVAVCMALLLTGCGSNEKTYAVTVKDALGTPYTTGVVVRFLQNGQQVAMQPCDENGVAAKTLPSGDYTAELQFTDSNAEYHYNADIKLTVKAPTTDVILAKTVSGEPQLLIVGNEEFDAYSLEVGCTYVKTEAGKRQYLFFTPTQAGVYEFSVMDGTDAVIGYYGAPHFVQEHSSVEVIDGKFSVSVRASMIGSGEGGTSVYVIGVDNSSEGCVIGVQRTGDPQKTIEDEPWTIYQKTATLSEYTLPAGATLGEFDLTASTDTYKIVKNEQDGFYHLNDENGPLVLVRLAEDCDYIACFATMLDRSGVSRYFFDENDSFVKKESYSECLLEYIEYVDEVEGVYPLTDDLKYIIQQRGDYVGWWNIDHNGYIFKDANGNNDPEINAEIAWLLMCCYIEG
ncbi:MAG: hypothetical protein E7553_03545 [Ruminococcaceae bacterium]|nr:hypothetical protein [Oscillospiraceae bacterium]